MVNGPKRPVNITITKTVLFHALNSGVIPKLRPTVPKAETVSNRSVKKGVGLAECNEAYASLTIIAITAQ